MPEEVTGPPEERADQLLREARRELSAAPFTPSLREATLLLGRVLGLDEAPLLARGERVVTAGEAARFRRLLQRRLRGEPVAYLLGEREFYGRSFRVDRRVLIPRPESEHLVEALLERRSTLPERPRLLDIGTGSGCLAVTLALELANSRVVATDLSPGALAVAAGNARRLGACARMSFVATDLEAALGEGELFDIVLSNPPYVAEGDRDRLSIEITDFEPPQALYAEQGGVAILLRLAALAARRLVPGGWLACEIGDGQIAALTSGFARVAPELEWAEVRKDYAGKPRTVILRRQPR